MAEMLTPDKIMEIGEKIRQRVLETATPEEKLAGLDPQEILARLDPQEILARLDPQEILARLDPQEILAGLTNTERWELLRLLQEEMDAASGEEVNSNGDAA